MTALINAQTEKTGVSAAARTEIQLGDFASGSAVPVSYTLLLSSNNDTGQAVGLSFTVGVPVNADSLSDAAKAFNDTAAKTGVTARVSNDGQGIVLTNAAGNDAKLINNSTTGNDLTIYQPNTNPLTGISGTDALAADSTVTAWDVTKASVVTGQITLDSSKSFTATNKQGWAYGGVLGSKHRSIESTAKGTRHGCEQRGRNQPHLGDCGFGTFRHQCRAPTTGPCSHALRQRLPT